MCLITVCGIDVAYLICHKTKENRGKSSKVLIFVDQSKTNNKQTKQIQARSHAFLDESVLTDRSYGIYILFHFK